MNSNCACNILTGERRVGDSHVLGTITAGYVGFIIIDAPAILLGLCLSMEVCADCLCRFHRKAAQGGGSMRVVYGATSFVIEFLMSAALLKGNKIHHEDKRTGKKTMICIVVLVAGSIT